MNHRCLALALGVAVAPGVAAAHVGDVIYPIYELPTSDLPDLHDESLADWDAALPGASLTHSDFTFSAGTGNRIDPSDLAWRVFLAWHHGTQRVYLAVERLDDVYLPPPESCCGGGEGATSFAIDADHSGGQYFLFTEEQGYSQEERRRLENAQAQAYTLLPEGLNADDDQKVHGGRLAYTWVSLPPWSDWLGTQYGEDPSYSMVECYVTPFDDLNWEGPERSRRSVLAPGRIVGFLASVTDHDVVGQFRSWSLLALPTYDLDGQPFTWAENFVDGELVPCNTGDCSQARSSAVRADSWGRIKAALR